MSVLLAPGEPHHLSWLGAVARALSTDLTAGDVCDVILSSGGAVDRSQEEPIVHIGRVAPPTHDEGVRLWCCANEEGAEELRASGAASEIVVTGHPDVALVAGAPRLRKRRPTAFCAPSAISGVAEIEALIRGLHEALPAIDLVLQLPGSSRTPVFEGQLAMLSARTPGFLPIPGPVHTVLPTLAQADVLISDLPEWIEPFMVLDRPAVSYGDRALWVEDRYEGAVESLDRIETVGARVAERLQTPSLGRVARQRAATRYSGDRLAVERIVAEIYKASEVVA